jgi:CRP-like cAMP-binding protein
MEYKIFQFGEVIMAARKNNVALAELRERDVFGEMELIGAVSIVIAMRMPDKAAILSFPNKKLYEIYKSDISMSAMVIRSLAWKRSKRLRRIDDMAAGGNEK